VLTTENLTFAQYARTGFWQLLTVTVLTLLIMAAVARKAHRSTPTDRLWLRGLLGAQAYGQSVPMQRCSTMEPLRSLLNDPEIEWHTLLQTVF